MFSGKLTQQKEDPQNREKAPTRTAGPHRSPGPPAVGIEALREADRVLGLKNSLEAGIGTVKQRNRGLTGGELLLSMASAQLAGEDFFVGLDRRRRDVAGQELEPVPTPPSTTAYGIAKRFGPHQLAGIETGIGNINTTMLGLLHPVRRSSLLKVATIDGDATDIEVYGCSKEKAAHAYTGALTLRSPIRFWAEAGVPLAAELMGRHRRPTRQRRSHPGPLHRRPAGRSAADPLSTGCQILRREPGEGVPGTQRRICFSRAKRTGKVMAAAAGLGRYTWIPTIGMENTEIAVIDYLPGAWPNGENILCIARRTRVAAGKIPTARARKRRTISKQQLALALAVHIDEVDSYSFILTNCDVSTEEELAEVEFWYRHRTDIEELNKNAKHGTAMRHLPSSSFSANSVWMWAGLLGCAVSAWIQEITGTDHGNGRGRRTVKTIRWELFAIPARFTRGAGITYLRLPPGENLLTRILPKLQELPSPG